MSLRCPWNLLGLSIPSGTFGYRFVLEAIPTVMPSTSIITYSDPLLVVPVRKLTSLA